MTEIIKDLELNSDEESVYLLLLSTGQLSSDEIAQQLKIKISEVESIIASLKTKDLIFVNQGIKTKYTAVYPLLAISEKAKNSLHTIKNIGDEINTFSEEKFNTLDTIVTEQKDSINKIVTEAKEGNRLASEEAAKEITVDLEKLIEDISQILNTEKRAINELATTTNAEVNKHFQEITESAGNTISSSVSDIVNRMDESKDSINKSFEASSSKVDDAAKVMHDSMQASLEDNLKDYIKITNEIQNKITKAQEQYSNAANDNITLTNQTISENYASVIDSVNSRLGVHDKQTEQILQERIRNISDTLSEMSDEFARLIKEKLNGIRREYDQMVESFSRQVESLFTDANTQLESTIAAKTKSNVQGLDNLFKLLTENLEKNADQTKEEIQTKQNRIRTELKAAGDTSQRKMKEINDKLSMELINNFNKARTDFETTKKNMSNITTRAKTDIITKFLEARNAAQSSISNEFKQTEDEITSIGSKILDDIRAVNNSSDTKTKAFIKDTQDRATSAIAKIEMPSKTLLNRGKQAALKAVQQQSNIVNKTIDGANSAIQDTIISETSKMKNQFVGFGDKYKESNKTIERLLANIELSYRELITRVKDVPRPVTKTTTLIGKQAVLNHMKDIFSRVKSTVTLVYPDINDIPKGVLLNSNPRTRIIVISDFDPFKNANLIKELMSKENIQLKSLVTDSTTKPYYAIGRDAEEGLVGSIDDSGEVIGITSQSQAFVELISAEIINAIITPKTKRVVLPEENNL